MSTRTIPTPEEEAVLAHILSDPILFAREMLQVDLWPVQETILRSVAANRKTAVKACHSSSKTMTAAVATLWWLARYEDGVVITSAPSQTQVEKLLWGEIHTLCANSHYKYPEPLLTELKFNSHRYALGFATNVTSQSEGTRFQGFHSKSGTVLVIFDESTGIPSQIFEAAEGILASNKARLLLLGNPTIASGNFYNCFHGSTRAAFNCITINAFNSPNLAGLTLESLLALSEEELDIAPRPYLVSRRWVKERFEELGEDHPLYQSRVLGEFPTQSDEALISLAWLEAARDRQLSTPKAPVIAGVDVGGGGDGTETVLTVRRGPEILLQKWWPHADARGSVVAVLRRYHDAGVLEAVNIDAIGVGKGTFDHLRDLGYPAVPIKVGDPARDTERFGNLKAELYFDGLRSRFESGDISGLLDETTIGQLAGIKYFHDARGRVWIEKKKDAARRGFKSPDRAESVMLAFAQVGTQGGVYAHKLTSVDDDDDGIGVIYDPEALRELDPGYGNAGWYSRRAIAVAFSLSMPLVALEICDTGKILWVTREYFYDNSSETHPLSSVEFYDHLRSFRRGLDPLTGVQHVRSSDCDAEVYLSDSDECEEFRKNCWRKGLPWTGVSMNSEELAGDIQRVSALLDHKLLRIADTCENLIEQLRNFRFDVRKAAQKGREEPVEDGRSQCVVALRMYLKTLDFWRFGS